MDYADLEIRILKKDTTGYHVEITFNGELEFPRGVLSLNLPALSAGASTGQDGVRLFQWLFADEALKIAWANARGQRPQRRLRMRIDEGAPELHQIPWDLLRDPRSWVARLCLIANRNLSKAEWQQFIGLDVPSRRTYPDLPLGESAPGK